MATLSTKARDKLPAGKFAGPGRSYPIPDASHAANAKARATQAVKAGRMSEGEKGRIDAKADKVLGEKKGAPAKKSYPVPDSPYGRKAAEKKPDAPASEKKAAPTPKETSKPSTSKVSGKKVGERLGAFGR